MRSGLLTSMIQLALTLERGTELFDLMNMAIMTLITGNRYNSEYLLDN
jgi:hypothetical protein